MAKAPPITDRLLKESDIDELMKIFRKLDAETSKEVLRTVGKQLTEAQKSLLMDNVRKLVEVADIEAKEWLVNVVPDIYVRGTQEADRQMQSLAFPVPAETITVDQLRKAVDLTVHREAVNALISDAYLDFANGMNGFTKGVEHVINEALRRQIRATMITETMVGADVGTIKKEIANLIRNEGYDVLIDRAGRKWKIDTYAEMLGRTHLVKSGNEGVIMRASQFNVDILSCSEHAGACTVCQPYEGKIFSVSGKSKKYPPLSEFPNPIHPRCRHVLLLRPDLEEDTE